MKGFDDPLLAVEGQVTKMQPSTARIFGDVERGDWPVPGIHPLVVIFDADDSPFAWWPAVVIPPDAFEKVVVRHHPRFRSGWRREDDVIEVEDASDAEREAVAHV